MVKNIEAAGRTLWPEVRRPQGSLKQRVLLHTGSPHGRHEITPEKNVRGKGRKGDKNHVRRVHVIYSHPQAVAHFHLDCAVRFHVSVWALCDTLVFRIVAEPVRHLRL